MKYYPYLIVGLFLSTILATVMTQYQGCINLELGIDGGKVNIQGNCLSQETVVKPPADPLENHG